MSESQIPLPPLVFHRWVQHDVECAIALGIRGLNGYVRLPADVEDQQLRGLAMPGGMSYGPENGWVGFDTAAPVNAWDEEELERHLLPHPDIHQHYRRTREALQPVAGLLIAAPDVRSAWSWQRMVAEVDAVAAQVAALPRAQGHVPGAGQR